MKFRIIILFIMAGIYIELCAQQIPDPVMNRDFEAQVKTIEDFIARFNGSANNPEFPDEMDRRKQILALFDYRMSHNGMPDTLFKNQLMSFVQTVNDSGITLKMTDAEMYAEIETNAKIAGKSATLFLIMQMQSYKENRNRWAIVSVKGLSKANIIDTTRFYPISPVDHETHFMSINDIFAHNSSEIIGYRGKNTRIDELSVFLTLSMMGNVRIEQVNNITMHCLEIPNYIFTINEYGRPGTNSGWLISKLFKTSEKRNYLIKLFGL